MAYKVIAIALVFGATPNAASGSARPSWIYIVVPLVIAALLGVIGNWLIEGYKTRSADKRMRALVATQLIEEARGNIFRLGNVRVLLQEAISGLPGIGSDDPLSSWIEAYQTIEKIESDRFKFYMDSQKPFVYQIDSKGTLKGFYEKIGTLKESITIQSADCDRQAKVAILEGQAFLKDQNIDFQVDLAPIRALRNRFRSGANKDLIDQIYDPPES